MANFPRAFRHYKPRSQKVFGVIIISSSKRYLIVQGRTSGIWSFPKGHITGSETSQECAMRETLEETGIDMTHHKPFMVKKLYAGEYFFYEVDDEYLAKPNDQNEICQAAWFTLDELKDLNVNADINNYISKITAGKLLPP